MWKNTHTPSWCLSVNINGDPYFNLVIYDNANHEAVSGGRSEVGEDERCVLCFLPTLFQEAGVDSSWGRPLHHSRVGHLWRVSGRKLWAVRFLTQTDTCLHFWNRALVLSGKTLKVMQCFAYKITMHSSYHLDKYTNIPKRCPNKSYIRWRIHHPPVEHIWVVATVVEHSHWLWHQWNSLAELYLHVYRTPLTRTSSLDCGLWYKFTSEFASVIWCVNLFWGTHR